MSDGITRPPANAGPKLIARTDERFSAELQKDLGARLTEIVALRTSGDAAEWALGNHYATVRDRRLFVQQGCPTMGQWFKAMGIGRTKAYALIDFASTFSAEAVKKYGSDRLWLLLDYAKLTIRDDREWNPEGVVLIVPGEHGVQRIPFRQARVEDLEAAVAHQNSLAQRRGEDLVPEHQKALKAEIAASAGPETFVRMTAKSPSSPELTRVTITTPLATLPGVLERVSGVMKKRRPR